MISRFRTVKSWHCHYVLYVKACHPSADRSLRNSIPADRPDFIGFGLRDMIRGKNFRSSKVSFVGLTDDRLPCNLRPKFVRVRPESLNHLLLNLLASRKAQ